MIWTSLIEVENSSFRRHARKMKSLGLIAHVWISRQTISTESCDELFDHEIPRR